MSNLPARQDQPVQPQSLAAAILLQVNNPNQDPARLREFLAVAKDAEEMQLRREARDAELAFNSAFAEVKLSLPSISKRGIIPDNNGNVRSRYARRDDLHEAITPLLTNHGFATSFTFRDAPGNRMTCSLLLTHRGGHSKVFEANGPWDMEIPKASLHQKSRGAQSFMKRNLLLDVFDILDRDVDDDATGLGVPEPISERASMELEDMIIAAEEKVPGTRKRLMEHLRQTYRVDGFAGLTADQGKIVKAQLATKLGGS